MNEAQSNRIPSNSNHKERNSTKDSATRSTKGKSKMMKFGGSQGKESWKELKGTQIEDARSFASGGTAGGTEGEGGDATGAGKASQANVTSLPTHPMRV